MMSRQIDGRFFKELVVSPIVYNSTTLKLFLSLENTVLLKAKLDVDVEAPDSR